MRCLAGQYWFAGICTHEKINTRRQRKFSYCYDNSFDHADPWKGSQEPPEVLGPHFEKHWLRLKSKKFPSLIPQILTGHPLRASNHPRCWEFHDGQNNVLSWCSSRSPGAGRLYGNKQSMYTSTSGRAKCWMKPCARHLHTSLWFPREA